MKRDEVIGNLVSLAFSPCRGPLVCGIEGRRARILRKRSEGVRTTFATYGFAQGDPCDACLARIAKHMIADIRKAIGA
jgi:hypothetical protein